MIKNASRSARTIPVVVPFSGLKLSIAECLKNEGYLSAVTKKAKKGHAVLELELAVKDEMPKVTDVKRISKPSRRVYMGVKEIRPARNGRGITVLSTPKGILTDKQARKEQVGGEALFMIW